MEIIQKRSRQFRYLCQGLFVILPVMTALYWFYAKHLPVSQLSLGCYAIPVTLNPVIQLAGFMVDLIPLSIKLFALHLLIKLFKRYEKGNIFEMRNVRIYRHLGYTLFCWAIANIINKALITFVLTAANKPGMRKIVVEVSSFDFMSFAAGCIIILIAWVMAEGYKLRREQQEII